MAEIEVENTYYEPVTETETIHICDACGEPCEENGGHYPIDVRGGWDDRYDLCGHCVHALDETGRALQTTNHPSSTKLNSNTEMLRRPIVEWVQGALVWARTSAWRFIAVFMALWIFAGLIGSVVEPVGGLLVLVLLCWPGYEMYRKYTSDAEFARRLEEHVAKGEEKLRDAADRGSTELRTILNDGVGTVDAIEATQEMDSRQSTHDPVTDRSVSGPNVTVDAGQQSGDGSDVPFDWYGDTDVDVDEVLDHIDTDLDPQTRARIRTSVKEHRERGEAVDAADIRWIAEATEELDFEGDHP